MASSRSPWTPWTLWASMAKEAAATTHSHLYFDTGRAHSVDKAISEVVGLKGRAEMPTNARDAILLCGHTCCFLLVIIIKGLDLLLYEAVDFHLRQGSHCSSFPCTFGLHSKERLATTPT